jgi:Contractile injection system tape measure protein
MPPIAANRILRQIVEFTTTTKDAFGFQRAAERFCAQELAPAIEHLIDSLDIPAGRLVQIDTVAITAVREGSTLDRGLLEQILRELRQELSVHIRNDSESKSGPKSVSYSIIEQLFVFLDRGYLPWSAAPAVEWNAGLEAALEELDPSQLRQMPAILSLERARFRLAACLSWNSLVRLWQALMTSEAEVVTIRIATEAHRLIGMIAERGTFHKLELTLARMALDQLFSRNAAAPSLFAEQTAELLRPYANQLELATALRTANRVDFPHLMPLLTSPRSPQPERHAVPKREEALAGNRAERPAKVAPEPVFTPVSEKAADSIYLEDAGLVIVAPYLPAFFRKLNLIEPVKISDPDTALSLLHYLTFGALPEHEAQLVLPKILCGLPLEKPADPATALSEEQLHEADELLGAIIANWPILKSTSVEGLRDTFLRREGALEWRSSEWALRIQRTGVDVLLDHLPWTISLIQLPWMPHPLRTDWA